MLSNKSLELLAATQKQVAGMFLLIFSHQTLYTCSRDTQQSYVFGLMMGRKQCHRDMMISETTYIFPRVIQQPLAALIYTWLNSKTRTNVVGNDNIGCNFNNRKECLKMLKISVLVKQLHTLIWPVAKSYQKRLCKKKAGKEPRKEQIDRE